MEERDVKTYSFFKQLCAIPVVEKIILYGSRARRDSRKRSDIDLALVCPQASTRDWLAIMDIVENADTLLGIDCVRLDTLSEKNPLKEAIMRDGVVLYQKDFHD